MKLANITNNTSTMIAKITIKHIHIHTHTPSFLLSLFHLSGWLVTLCLSMLLVCMHLVTVIYLFSVGSLGDKDSPSEKEVTTSLLY